jgi:MarR family 2-MHQ and catechol resistance regulon transcriptional repressor
MKVTQSAPGPRYRALIELLKTAETLWNASRIFFARWDISPSQFNVLNLLQDHPGGCSQIELSRHLIMHRSNLTGLLDRMEARGLVRRTDNPDDRRAFNVKLTPEGKKLLNKILPHYHEAAESVWADIPAERADQLVAELQTLAHSTEEFGNSLAKKEV